MIHSTSLPVKLFDGLLVAAAFLANGLFINPDWQPYALAVGGSLSGSLALAYFRRDPGRFELFIKVVVSAMCGFVLGSGVQEYMQIVNPKYLLCLFFGAGMSAVAVFRALLTVTEQNAHELIKRAAQRVAGVTLPGERSERKRRRVKKLPDGRFITLPDKDEKDGEQ